jgi:hypothetical protein
VLEYSSLQAGLLVENPLPFEDRQLMAPSTVKLGTEWHFESYETGAIASDRRSSASGLPVISWTSSDGIVASTPRFQPSGADDDDFA